MPRRLTDEEARAFGVETMHHVMDNGERRFRLTSADGSSYIRTEASSEGGWQNSHVHKELTEIYVVQRGWIIYAELTAEGKLTMKKLQQGEVIVVTPHVHHNLYMRSHSVTHVVKYGAADAAEADWHPSPALDGLTRCIVESELLQI